MWGLTGVERWGVAKYFICAIRGGENRVGESFKNVVRRKERFMDELDLDYIIIKLKKKSPADRQKKS